MTEKKVLPNPQMTISLCVWLTTLMTVPLLLSDIEWITSLSVLHVHLIRASFFYLFIEVFTDIPIQMVF